MNIIPVKFEIERTSFLPIIKVTGVTKAMPGIENILISKAVEIIEKAEKLKGRVMEINENQNMNDIPKGMVAVRFHIIFKDEQDFSEGVSGLKRELG